MASFRNAGPVEHRLPAICNFGINHLVIEAVDALDDLRADSWRESHFGTDLDKARPSKHLRRRGVVMRHAAVDRPGRLDRKEGPKCARRQAFPPSRRVDPLGNLPFSFHREAGHRPYELRVVVDR